MNPPIYGTTKPGKRGCWAAVCKTKGDMLESINRAKEYGYKPDDWTWQAESKTGRRILGIKEKPIPWSGNLGRIANSRIDYSRVKPSGRVWW